MALAWLAAVLCTPAAAQDSPAAASIKALQAKSAASAPRAAAARDPAVSAVLPRSGRKPVMRCWQEGRLIFEGAGLSAAPSGSNAIDLHNGSALALQIFDLKNGLCLLDHGAD